MESTRPASVIEAVDVIVIVIALVIVAALENGNETVAVIEAVDDPEPRAHRS